MRRRYEADPEPISIGVAQVVAELERLQRPRMASFVRDINQMTASDRREAVKWRDVAERLQKRLEQYEPPQAADKPHDPRPPAEASD